MPNSHITAWDISTDALSVAKENNRLNGTNVTFAQTDILSYNPTGETFDIIVSNPPYIPNEEVRAEFVRVVKSGEWKEVIKMLSDSERLLQ